MAYYKVKINARYIQRKSRRCYAECDVYVEASSPEEAEEKALEKAPDMEGNGDFHFDEDFYEDDEPEDTEFEPSDSDEPEELDPVDDKEEIEGNLDIDLDDTPAGLVTA
jgi:hypothetical protein